MLYSFEGLLLVSVGGDNRDIVGKHAVDVVGREELCQVIDVKYKEQR